MRITFYKSSTKQLIFKLRFAISTYHPEGKAGFCAGKFCFLHRLHNLHNLHN